MGFFSKLFGGDDSSSPAYTKADSADIWPAKFLTIAITEVQNEAANSQQLKEVIGEIYPHLSDENYTSIADSVMDMNNLVVDSKDTWDNLWDNFCSQLSDYKNSESFEVVRNVSNTAFLIKMIEEMDEISENYNYRFGANLEQHTSLCKEDIISIMEEEKENSGYNAYLDDI